MILQRAGDHPEDIWTEGDEGDNMSRRDPNRMSVDNYHIGNPGQARNSQFLR